jgi:hypothetical protein
MHDIVNFLEAAHSSHALKESLDIIDIMTLSCSIICSSYPTCSRMTINALIKKYEASLYSFDAIHYIHPVCHWILAGTLPSGLCKQGPNSPLNNLFIARNLLTGPLNISTCGNLYFMDCAVRSIRSLNMISVAGEDVP